MVYLVYYGALVPFSRYETTKWSEAAAFIKQNLDAGLPIHSVHTEKKEK